MDMLTSWRVQIFLSYLGVNSWFHRVYFSFRVGIFSLKCFDWLFQSKDSLLKCVYSLVKIEIADQTCYHTTHGTLTQWQLVLVLTL